MKMCEQILKKKKHSRTSPEIQFKELNENLELLYSTSRSNQRCQLKHKQNKKLSQNN